MPMEHASYIQLLNVNFITGLIIQGEKGYCIPHPETTISLGLLQRNTMILRIQQKQIL